MNIRSVISKYVRTPFKYWPLIGFEKIPGWLTEEQAYYLFDLALKCAQATKRAVFVEIGAWQGKSSFVLAKAARGGHLYSIDPFDGAGDRFFEETYKRMVDALGGDMLKVFIKNMKKYGVQNRVTPLKGFSEEVAHTFTKEIDFLFIDGNHDYEFVKQDFLMWEKKVRKGGYIVFHDVDVNPETTSEDILNSQNSHSGIFGPARVVAEYIVNAEAYIRKEWIYGMYVCQKK